MNIQVTTENSFVRKLSVEVPASDVDERINKAYANFQATAHLKGFRKGKAPRKVLEARFGPRVQYDVANDLVQAGYTAAIAEHGLDPVSRPSLVDQGELEEGNAFNFTIEVDVKPELDSAEYKGLDVYWPKSEVSDEDVDASVQSRLQGRTRRVAVEDRGVQKGDHVQVELGFADGDEQVHSEPGTLVRTEGDAWYPGLEDLLTGMSVDDTKTEEVTFAESARTEQVAGKTLTVTAKVLGIQADEVPELSDELAEEMGFEGGIDGMKAKIREDIASAREDAARTQARANLLSAMIEANTFEVPAGMIDANLEMLMDELRMQAAYRGQDPKSVRFNDAQVADLRSRAAFAAKGAVLLEYVWGAESIEVSDDDIEAKIAELAESRGQTVEAIKGYFQGDAIEDLRQRILEEKTLDWLLEQANVSHEPQVDTDNSADAEPAAESEEAADASDSDEG